MRLITSPCTSRLPGGLSSKRKIADIKAVDGISFHIKQGETLGLVGESGCGKTTTGRAVLQLYKPTTGSVKFYDQEQDDYIELTELKGEPLRKMRRKIQIIFQDPYGSLNPRMSCGAYRGRAAQNPLALPTARNTRIVWKSCLLRWASTRILPPRYPHEFSGGQRQRIGIARALASNPSFIVCDEPISALDVSIQAQIINLLEDLQQKFGLT